MIWTDEDGDSLEIKEVFGFGKTMFLVRVTQDGEESQMNIDEKQLDKIIDFLEGLSDGRRS
jgi:hypothetical protein